MVPDQPTYAFGEVELPAYPRHPQGKAEADGAEILVGLPSKKDTVVLLYSVGGSSNSEENKRWPTPLAMELPGSLPPTYSEVPSPEPSWRHAEMPSPETVAHRFPGVEANVRASRTKDIDDAKKPDNARSGATTGWPRNSYIRNTSYELRISTQTSGPTRCYNELSGSQSEAQPILDRDFPQDYNLVSPLSPNSLQSARQYLPIPTSPTASPTPSATQAQPIDQDSQPTPSTQYSITTADKEKSGELRMTEKQSSEKAFVAISGKDVSQLDDGEIPQPSNLASPSNRDAPYTMEVANPLAQVEGLDQLICVLNGLWQEYLNNRPTAHSLLNGLNLGSPFDEGLSGFKSCLGGKPPTTLRSVFSFVHLAYACAYICHGNDASFSWVAFYENVLHWGQAISHQQERNRFLMIADLLWSPPQTPFNITATMLPAYTYPTQEPFQHESAARSMSNMHSHHAYASSQEIGVSMTAASPILTPDLQSALETGVVVECCTRFLDGKTS